VTLDRVLVDKRVGVRTARTYRVPGSDHKAIYAALVLPRGSVAPVFDETLYLGSAAHYPVGRMPYPPAIASALRAELGLDGTGRLLDVGCGPGSLTLLLAPLFEAAAGVDADAGMIERARSLGPDVEWHVMRAEELPAGLGTFRVVTFAQSFHWMDQPVVADRVRGMLDAGGAWVHVQATTHRGIPLAAPTELPAPPWDAIDDLVAAYLGPVRRAGRAVLPNGSRSGEEDVMRAAGYRGPARVSVGGGEVVERTADAVLSAVFSLSSSAPHLYGDQLAAFEADLRALLAAAAPGGRFAERTHEVNLVIWRP
jgi:SAM-dependent methyltransferase